jgi:MoaA/NifB/PqqE/SkfB family radical SAM enzyme
MNLQPEGVKCGEARRHAPAYPPSHLFDGLVIVWRVTEQCNLACLFCGYSRLLDRPRATANPGSVLTFGALLRDYSRAYQRDVMVSWLGGEPLIWPPLRQLTRAFKHEFGLCVSVTTNGAALDSRAVRGHIIADYDEITVSIDGVGELNDRVRGAPGLYEQLRASLIALRDLKSSRGRGPLIRVNTILMRDTIDQIESLCHTLAGWGVEELTFNMLGGRDRPEFYPDHRLLPEQVEWLRAELPGIRERMARLGLRICGSPVYLERIASAARDIPIPVADCAPGSRVLFIDERSHVSPCSFTATGYGIPVSGIHSPGDLDQLPARFAASRRAPMLPPCFDCTCTKVFGKFE